MKVVTSFTAGAVSGESARSNDLAALIPDSVDFLFGASGWDDRCLALTTISGLTAHRSAVLLFKDKGNSGRAKRNDVTIRDFYSSLGGESSEIEESAERLDTIWNAISALLVRAWHEKDAPLDILIDLSACPRYLPLGVMASGMDAGIIRRVRFLYNEAEYLDEQQPDLFTKGSWESVEIPGFAGAQNPGRPRRYVVSVGFEGAKTARFVNRADPDSLTILFPSPGYRADYPARTWGQNRTLFADYGIKDLKSPGVVTAPAGDAIAGWKSLTEKHLERSDEENVYYLCCGPKPHSLALALRAMASHAGAVIYPKPSAHRESEIHPSDEFWLYTIEDRSVPATSSEAP